MPLLTARRQTIAASNQKLPYSRGTHGESVICFGTLNDVPLTPAKPSRNLPTNQEEYRGKSMGFLQHCLDELNKE